MKQKLALEIMATKAGNCERSEKKKLQENVRDKKMKRASSSLIPLYRTLNQDNTEKK